MSRAFLITMLTGAFLAMPAFVPATTTSLSGSALAQTPSTDAVHLNTSRSNVNRMDGGPGKPPKAAKTGKGTPTGSANKTINLNTGRTN